jgi:hypothetical protein
MRFFAMQSNRFYEVFGNLGRALQGTAHGAALDRPLGTLGTAHVGAASRHRRRRVEHYPATNRNQAQQLGLGTDRPAPDAAPVRSRAYDAGSSAWVATSTASTPPSGPAASGAGSSASSAGASCGSTASSNSPSSGSASSSTTTSSWSP